MSKFAAIIGSDEKIIEKANPIIKSRRYELRYIIYNTVDYQILDEVGSIYIDDRIPFALKEAIFQYAVAKRKKLFLIPSSLTVGESSRFHSIDELLAIPIHFHPLSLPERAVKRLFDFVMSLAAIILLSWLMILIAAAIKFDDGGPVLYLQRRMTKNHQEFVIFKFRTMIVNAEKDTGISLSAVQDARVTRIGHFLRKTRLDELPQFFNVLIGDMSMVGPRPERSHYVRLFEKENRFYQYRFFVKAGITGLSQIHCRYNTGYEDKLKYDLLYISRFRFFMDLMIILKTFRIFFNNDAAEGVSDENFYDLLIKKRLWIWEREPNILELIKK